MAFYAPGGLPETEDDPEPVRRANRQFVEHLEFLLEAGEQMLESCEHHRADHLGRIEALERRTAILEALFLPPGGAR